MKNFIQIRLVGDVGPTSLIDEFRKKLPDFAWRAGDSDSQGPYISGTNADAVQLMFWFGEQPNDLTISFARASSTESRRVELVEHVLQRLTPSLGRVIEVLGIDYSELGR